jgi:hypothetical protein
MKALSANDIIEESISSDKVDRDDAVFDIWVRMFENTVKAHGKTMDDDIFVMNEDGIMYDVVVENTDDAYNRAMSGV